MLSQANMFRFDLFCLRSKFLVYNLVSRNLKLRYRQSAIGILWSLLLPICNAMVYFIVFSFILKVKIPNYLPFIVSGSIAWSFLSQCVMDGMDSLKTNLSLISKIPLPLHVFPLVSSLTSLVHFAIAFLVIVAAVLGSGLGIHWSFLFLPYLAVLFFLVGYGCALFMSIVVVYTNDLRQIMTVVLQLWFYATPIIYQPEMIPQRFKWTLYLNPAGSLFVMMRDILIQGQWPNVTDILAGTLWALALTLAGMVIFRHQSTRIPEML